MPLAQRHLNGMRSVCLAGTGDSGRVERERLLAPSKSRRWVMLKRVLMELRVVAFGVT